MLMRKWLPAIVAGGVYLLLSAEPACAWGLATHVQLAHEMLSRLALLPASIAGILTRCGLDYVYGNIAADVVIAKRLSRVKQFCHHWSTGLVLLNDADTEPRRAFALGYLSHLAADTVAHNKYIPYQMLITPTTRSVGHVYWELRAEQIVPDRYWPELRRLLYRSFPEHQACLSQRLDQALLPFELNSRIFYSLNRFFSNFAWRRGTRAWHKLSRWPLDERLLAGYRAECLERTWSVLTFLQSSPVLREDPNGTGALSRVPSSRRHLRRMARAEVLTAPAIGETLAHILPAPGRTRALSGANVA
jgi:hypothetical protein